MAGAVNNATCAATRDAASGGFRWRRMTWALTWMMGMIMGVTEGRGEEALAFPDRFVSPEWLAERLDHPGLRIVQVGGESYYEKIHLPGAVYLDYKRLLSAEEGVGGRRADVEALVALITPLGIAPETAVLAYDATGGMDGARFLWTLMTLGHDRGAVLDGGMAIWHQKGLPLTPTLPRVTPVPFVPRERRGDWGADWERVMAISEGRLPGVLLDVRSPREYLGISLKMPRGHVPGAVNLEWTETLADPRQPLLKADEENRRILAEAGVNDPHQEVVALCETGHRAAQTWLLLQRLGFTKSRLYDGSMAEWRARELPTVTGSDPR
ncbi:MAG: sulfurtransferase [Magnetococcales bacterium]|nr:sulfurtransferase [Magnetococcales bacterium]